MTDQDSELCRALRVFLCHSSGDKNVVRKLYHRLCSDHIDPWFDEEKLLPGQDWDLEITKAVRSSDVVIVCLSQDSISKIGYVQNEIRKALDIADLQPEGAIFLIPLKLHKCDIPERFRRWHWVNYFENEGYQRLMSALQARASDLGLCLDTEDTSTCPMSCSPWSDSPGSEIAVRFSPKSYPAKLKRVRFFITSLAKPWTQFEVRVYEADEIDQPGSRLNSDTIVGAGKLGNEWIELDLVQHYIVITHGDFFVSMVWTTIPGPRGKNAQFLGAKANNDMPGRSLFKFGGADEWILRNDKNCFIQAILDDDLIIENS